MNKKLRSSKKLSLLITIVHREKTEFYVDALQQFGINMQMIAVGNGTTKTTIYTEDIGTKGIIFSVIQDEKINDALSFLDRRFKTLINGKGVAFTVPLSSVMGVHLYNFLSNNTKPII